jgi:hypothetical protein
MTTDECHQKALTCAAQAALAQSEAVALEFMLLAAQWRAMAVRLIYLGPAQDFVDAFPASTVVTPVG